MGKSKYVRGLWWTEVRFEKTLEKTEKRLTLTEKEILRRSKVSIDNNLRFSILKELETLVRIILIKGVPSWVCIYLIKWDIKPINSNSNIMLDPETTPKYVAPFHEVSNLLLNPLNPVFYRDLIDESWEKWLTFISTENPNNYKTMHRVIRIRRLNWRVVNNLIVDICLAIASLDLPAYVLLEILDHVPFIGNHVHNLKIGRIIQIKKSIEKIRGTS